MTTFFAKIGSSEDDDYYYYYYQIEMENSTTINLSVWIKNFSTGEFIQDSIISFIPIEAEEISKAINKLMELSK